MPGLVFRVGRTRVYTGRISGIFRFFLLHIDAVLAPRIRHLHICSLFPSRLWRLPNIVRSDGFPCTCWLELFAIGEQKRTTEDVERYWPKNKTMPNNIFIAKPVRSTGHRFRTRERVEENNNILSDSVRNPKTVFPKLCSLFADNNPHGDDWTCLFIIICIPSNRVLLYYFDVTRPLALGPSGYDTKSKRSPTTHIHRDRERHDEQQTDTDKVN